ncbi:hypothetical protein K9M48_00355 [Candidatus Gracilibacteria bacterium]|nr:hypothetical protein [Candidatus Gracilibacteria bacterium]
MYNKYSHSKLINHIYNTLPMDEFVKGNFSRAGEIIDQYQELLKKCFEEAESKYLGNLNMKDYIAGELENLLKEKDELESQKKEIMDKLNEVKQLINKLKKENKGDRKWEAIYKKFEEFGSSPSDFEEFLGALKINNPENYKIGEDMIIRFLDSENYKKIKEWMEKNSIFLLKNKRNSITKKLSHKGNFMNIEKQINDIKTGRTQLGLERNIRDNVKEFFGKKINYYEEEDPRNLKAIYMDTVISRIILNKNTNEKLRNELIKKFNDKIGFWDYIWEIYRDLKIEERKIKEILEIENNVEINLKEEMINSIMKEIQYRVDFCKEQYPMWLDAINQSDIEHIEEKIRGEKTQSRNMEINSDRRAREVFFTLRDYLEHNELADKFEMIWDYDYWQIDIDVENFKNILNYLLKYMDEEDRKDIVERYGDWNAFKRIENESIKDDEQLELFN